MDHVFARVNRLRKNPYFKIISNYTLYDPVNYEAKYGVAYSPDHRLDEETWFKIEKFSAKPYCLTFLASDFDSKDYADLKKEKFSSIAFIFSVQGGDFYFQKISPSLFIRRKTIVFGEVAEVEESGSRLLINRLPDAVYLRSADTLLFKNLATISSIFAGIDVLYKEATTEQVNCFLNQEFIAISPGFNANLVSKPNRRRVAMAMDVLEKMSPDSQSSMLDYINGYVQEQVSFNAASKQFTISKDEELRILLYGIDERFYTTPFGNEKRLANSVQKVA